MSDVGRYSYSTEWSYQYYATIAAVPTARGVCALESSSSQYFQDSNGLCIALCACTCIIMPKLCQLKFINGNDWINSPIPNCRIVKINLRVFYMIVMGLSSEIIIFAIC